MTRSLLRHPPKSKPFSYRNNVVCYPRRAKKKKIVTEVIPNLSPPQRPLSGCCDRKGFLAVGLRRGRNGSAWGMPGRGKREEAPYERFCNNVKAARKRPLRRREIANHNLTDKNIQTYLYLFLHSLANCRCGETRGKNKQL